MIGRAVFNFIALLFTAGSVLLLFFIVLAGGVQGSSLLRKWYWLAADTSQIPGADYPISRWSMYGVCGYEGSDVSKPGRFIGCTSSKPAYPFDPIRNFGSNGVPDVFRRSQNSSYYETRFQFAFYLIALFFEVCTLFVGLAAFKVRALAFTSGALSLLSFLFVTPAAALSTAAYVHGRSHFKQSGWDAKLGPALYGFAWAVVFMSICNLIIFNVIAPAKQSSGSGASGPGWASRFKAGSKSGGAPFGKRSGYTFGFGSRKTTDGPAKGETSSFVRA